MGGEAGGALAEEVAALVAAAAVAAAAADGTAVVVGREASGDAELDELTDDAGDGGKNSGNAFFSMRWTVSSLNHDERTGTVQPCTTAAADETVDADSTVRDRGRVGEPVRDTALTGDVVRRGALSVPFSSFSFCRASLRRSDEMVGAASEEADGTDSCLLRAVGLAAVEAEATEVGEEAVEVRLEVGDTTAETRETGLCCT